MKGRVITVIFAALLVAAEPADKDKPVGGNLLKAKPLKTAPGDDELQRLLTERYNAALLDTQDRFDSYFTGSRPRSSDPQIGALGRLPRSGLEVYNGSAERVTFLRDIVALMKELERVQQD